jgi:hypothetical protein
VQPYEEVTRDGAVVDLGLNVRYTFPKRAVHPDDADAAKAEERRARRREEEAAKAAMAAKAAAAYEVEDGETSLADFLKDAGWGAVEGGDGDVDDDDHDHGGSNRGGGGTGPTRHSGGGSGDLLPFDKTCLGGGAALSSRERKEAMFPRDQLRATRQRSLAVGLLYKLNPVVTHSLKAPGFKP